MDAEGLAPLVWRTAVKKVEEIGSLKRGGVLPYQERMVRGVRVAVAAEAKQARMCSPAPHTHVHWRAVEQRRRWGLGCTRAAPSQTLQTPTLSTN